MKNPWVLALCFGFLLFVCLPNYKVSSNANDLLKVSDDLEATLSQLSPSDKLLLWLDVYIPPLPDGNIYLCSSDLSQITDLGVKIAGATFSLDKPLLWFLVEASTAQVSSLAGVSMVQKVSLAKVGIWDWWDKNWRKETSIDPLLNITMQRVERDFPNAKVPVVINYAEIKQNKTAEIKQEIIGEITSLVKSIDGEVARVGIAEYILANVPPTALNRLRENKYVRTLETERPAYLAGCSLRKSMSNNPSQLLIFPLPLYGIGYSIRRKPRKVKSTIIIILLLVTGFLLSCNMPPTYALDVSRQAIRADQVGYNGNEVVVAVIDTGIDFNHGDLAPAILDNVDFYRYPDGTPMNDPMDYEGHGTHVAGIVASRSGTYTGIAPGSQIINLKVAGNAEMIRDAIQWCIDNRTRFGSPIRVIQMSLVEPFEQPGDGTDPLSMKADEAVEAGIVVVVAVYDHDTDGDGRYELTNPQQAFNVIAVGAVQDQGTINISDDILWPRSAHGPTTDGRPKPDVVAPGDRTDNPDGIWSTRSAQAPDSKYEAINGVYGCISGTSQAAPHVAGTVALMLEANPNLTPAQVKGILRKTARLTPNLIGHSINEVGYGIIDAYEAVQMAQNVGTLYSSYMYDSWTVETPPRSYDPFGISGDYLKFKVDAPSSTFGVSISQVNYYYWNPWGTNHFELLNLICASHVWIDGTYYNLGNDMNKYLFTGPRIIEKGDGYVRMRARYRVNNIIIEYQFKMGVDEMWLRVNYQGGSSWRTLIYIDADVWDTLNYAFTSEIIYNERRITDLIPIDIRDTDHSEFVQIQPQGSDNPVMWILRHGYFGNNPDTALNNEDIYNQNIVIYYQGTSSASGPTIYRRTLAKLVWLMPWTDLTEIVYWDTVVAYYRAMTGVEIQLQPVSKSALHYNIVSRYSGHIDTDIISMPAMWLPEFANWKMPILAEPPSWVQAYVKSNWTQAAIDSVTWKSFVWGYPRQCDPWALVYNRKIFNDVINSLPDTGYDSDHQFLERVLAKLESDTPLRWDLGATSEFVRAAKLLTKRSGEEITQRGFCPMIAYRSEEERYQFLSLLWSNGGDYLNLTKPAPLFNSTKGVDVMQLYYNLGFVYETYNPLEPLDQWDTAFALEKQTVAMMILPTWMGVYIRDAMGVNFNNLGISPIPVGQSGDPLKSVSPVDNWLIGVSQEAKDEGKADAAWSFLTWLNTPMPAESIDLGGSIGKIPKGDGCSIMGDFLIYHSSIPSRKSDQQNGRLNVGGAPGPLIQDDFWFKGFIDMNATYGRSDVAFLTSYKANDEIGTMFEKVVFTGITPVSYVVRDAATAISKILPIAGDVNINGVVDIYDAVILIADWFATPGTADWNRGRSDCNDDNYSGLADALIIVDNYEKTWTP